MADEKKTGAARGQKALGELILREQAVSPEAWRRAQAFMAEKGTSLGAALTQTGALNQSALVEYLAQTYGFPAVSVADLEISDNVRQLITRELIIKHKMIPVSVDFGARKITMAFCDPEQIKNAMDDIKFTIGFEI